jgi:hypothetical protein
MHRDKGLASRLSVCILAAIALSLVGCGGGDDAESATPEEITACAEDAGLSATTRPGDAEVGITGSVEVEVSPENKIIVDLFDDADRASEYNDGQEAFLSATGGSSEVIGETAVIGVLRPGAEDDLETIKGCVD